MEKTPLDMLKEELLRRGYSKQQIEAKAIVGVLEILASDNGRVFLNLDEAASKLKKLQAEVQSLTQQKDVCMRQLQNVEKIVQDEADRQYGKMKQYMDKLMQALNECETPEGRDGLRLAQMYVNSVNVDTKYDNTAYISGLAAILSQGRISALDELKKINPAIPSLNFTVGKGGIEPKDDTTATFRRGTTLCRC